MKTAKSYLVLGVSSLWACSIGLTGCSILVDFDESKIPPADVAIVDTAVPDADTSDATTAADSDAQTNDVTDATTAADSDATTATDATTTDATTTSDATTVVDGQGTDTTTTTDATTATDTTTTTADTGTTTTDSTTAATDSAADTADSSTAFAVAAGGYVTAGTWMGYASPGGSVTTTPADFTGIAAGDQLCISAPLGATDDASISVNIDQTSGTATTANAVLVPSGSTGLAYTLTNSSGLAPNSVTLTDGANMYTVAISTLSGQIPWGSFAISGGASFAPAADSVVSIEFDALAPGTAATANFCLAGLATY